MRYLLSLLIVLPALLFAQTPIANIQDSTSVYSGQTVTIEGVVTIGAGVTNDMRLNAFIQDESGKGMMLFDYDLTTAYEADIVRGAKLQVTGEVSEYQGVTELTGFTYSVIETGVDISPFIVSLTVDEARDTDEWEGTLAQVSGALYEDPYTGGGGVNLNIEDSEGDRITVRVWDSTGMTLPALAQGSEITAVGAVAIYNSNGQILPGYDGDVTAEVTEEPIISNVNYTPSAPTMDDPINVSCTITDSDGTIEEAFLEYRTAAQTTFTSVDMDDDGNDYYGQIPAMSSIPGDSDSFIFRITALDDDDNSVTSSETTVTIGGGSQFTPIATIQDNINLYDGQEVEIEGVITLGAGILRNDQLNAYIQDESGRGLQLYASSITSAYENDIIRGNRLQVTGTIDEYNGTTEITDFTYTVVETGVDLASITPDQTIDGIQLYDYWEGTYVKVQGLVLDAYYAGGGQNITLVDGDGTELELRIWDTAHIDYSQVFAGDEIIAKGVVDSYNNAPQLLPGYQEDILNLANPISQVEWTPDPPFAGDEITINARIEYTGAVTSATLSWALAGVGVYNGHDIAMTSDDGIWWSATLPTLASQTSEDDNFLVKISAQSAGETITSNVIEVIVYSGAPIFSDIDVDSDAMDEYQYVDFPFVDEPVDVVVTITDLDGTVASAQVRYGLNSAASLDSVAIMIDAGSDHWTAEIPPMTELTSLDDDYVIQIEATDDEGRVTRTEEMLVEVAPRCPIVSSVNLTNEPAPGEDLTVRLRIYDTDGSLDKSSAMLWYSFDYNDDILTAPLTVDPADSTLFTGVISGRSGGTTVYVNAEAQDYNGLAASQYPNWVENTREYTWPVSSHTAILKIPPKPFDPYHGETIPIDYNAKTGDKVILRIFSAEGKLVHTPVNGIVSSDNGVNRYEWDGRNRARRLLPLGIYICHLEVVSAEGGDKKTDQAPIVIGAPLN